jgi:RNA polymerase sigma-70 factor (sigma-E family)
MRRAEREEGFTEFVASRQAHLRRLAYAICGDRDQAEDLLQTSLAKLYVAWPRVRRDGREEAYCRQVILRSHIDETRRPHRRESPGLDGLDPAAPAPPAASSYEERSVLFDALQALPTMQRKVVVLRHWLGLSVRETATELGIAEGTVKSHDHRGLAALQAALAPR